MKNLDLSYFPEAPWVYLFKDRKGSILYIWKAKNLKKRVSQYFTPGSVWKQEMVAHAENVEFIVVENESESLYLESNLIKKHQPPFNNMLKWANAYAYIKLTKHPVPQIFITRKKINDWGTYIWPKHHTKDLKKFLQYWDKSFNIEHVLYLNLISEKFALTIIFDYVNDDAVKNDFEILNIQNLLLTSLRGIQDQ